MPKRPSVPMIGRHHSYSFTINNHTSKTLMQLFDINFKYLIIGFEQAPKTGTPHIQGYIQYWYAKEAKLVKKDITKAHIEPSVGDFQSNIDYCMKDNVWFEYGIKPTKGGKLTYEQVHAAMQDPHNNMTIVRQYGKVYEQIRQQDIANTEVKTRYYRMIVPNNTLKKQAIATDHLLDSIGIPISELIIVSHLSELAPYKGVDLAKKTIVLLHPVIDNLLPLYPRGVPMHYKFGYEFFPVKPKQLIVISQFAEILSHYKIYECPQEAELSQSHEDDVVEI